MTRPVTEDLALWLEKAHKSRPKNPDHDALRKVMGGRIEAQPHVRKGRKYRHRESPLGVEGLSVLDVADPAINTKRASVPLSTTNLLGQTRPITSHQRPPQAQSSFSGSQTEDVSESLREVQHWSAIAAALDQADGPLSDQARLAMMPQHLNHVAKRQLLNIPEQDFRAVLVDMNTQRRNQAMQNRFLPGGGPGTPGQRNILPFQQSELQPGMADRIHQTSMGQRNEATDDRIPIVPQRGPNLTQEQISILTPAQQAAVKAQLLNAQDVSKPDNGKTPQQSRPVPISDEMRARMNDPVRNNKLNMIVNEVEKSLPPGQPNQIPQPIRVQLQGTLQKNLQTLKKVDTALKAFYASFEADSGSETVIRQITMARCLLFREMNLETGILNNQITLATDGFTLHLRTVLNFVATITQRLKQTQQSQNANTQQTGAAVRYTISEDNTTVGMKHDQSRFLALQNSCTPISAISRDWRT